MSLVYQERGGEVYVPYQLRHIYLTWWRLYGVEDNTGWDGSHPVRPKAARMAVSCNTSQQA
jgi:hypothetical protein